LSSVTVSKTSRLFFRSFLRLPFWVGKIPFFIPFRLFGFGPFSSPMSAQPMSPRRQGPPVETLSRFPSSRGRRPPASRLRRSPYRLTAVAQRRSAPSPQPANPDAETPSPVTPSRGRGSRRAVGSRAAAGSRLSPGCRLLARSCAALACVSVCVLDCWLISLINKASCKR
jgi:hypothetical protein